MASLLHLDSAANRTGESVSRQLTALFADIWRTRHGEAGYRYRDLVAEPVPPLDTAYCTLGRRLERGGLVAPSEVGALTGNPADRREWASTLPLITELLAAETVLIGAPMYNYAIPAALKAWIDRVSFPGAFTEPTTGENLLRDTQIVVISSRGGAYGKGTPRAECDFHTPYLRAHFTRHGVPAAHLHFVNAELTVAALLPRLAELRPTAERSLHAARMKVRALANDAIGAPPTFTLT